MAKVMAALQSGRQPELGAGRAAQKFTAATEVEWLGKRTNGCRDVDIYAWDIQNWGPAEVSSPTVRLLICLLFRYRCTAVSLYLSSPTSRPEAAGLLLQWLGVGGTVGQGQSGVAPRNSHLWSVVQSSPSRTCTDLHRESESSSLAGHRMTTGSYPSDQAEQSFQQPRTPTQQRLSQSILQHREIKMASGNASYYNKNAHSPALVRARRPYLFKNAVVGAGIAAFAIGVYVYTIKAIGQDEFADVKVPDAPQQPAKK
ncbi:hypothetical protein JX265_006410 [Neoarthrinium moseri]|uniref:Cytochrome c oxidase assembly factor 3 n=1 Tax=Neoarthrinium moseri TaxID=1658444 RepID=A0A9P9WM63_9PEZI|nr:hypothetical protein JX265_006410 [Neoarthrinium moseri]